MSTLLNTTPNDLKDWNAQAYALAKSMDFLEHYLMEDRGADGKLVTAKAFWNREDAMAMERGHIWRLLWKSPVDGKLTLVAHQCLLAKPGAPKIVGVPK